MYVITKHKISLSREFVLDLRGIDPQFLHAECLPGLVQAWFLENPDAPPRAHTFLVLRTGDKVEDGIRYLATFLLYGGNAEFHLFKRVT